MIVTTRPAPFFIADDRALDFLNSVASPWGNEIEWLSCGRDLLDWLEQAGLVPTTVLTQFREQAVQGECDAVSAQACELREWFRTFIDTYAGQSLNSSVLAELDTLNHLLAHDTIYGQIEAEHLSEQAVAEKETSLLWRYNRRWNSPDTLLLPLAEAMGELICRIDFTRIKCCEGPKCTLWFHDISQNHTRRWCSMAVCGNRAKAAAHRAKKRSSRSETSSKN